MNPCEEDSTIFVEDDTTNPVPDCKTGVSVSLNPLGGATVVVEDVANASTDECQLASTLITGGATSLTCGDLGTVTYTVTATDAAGNSADCMTTVDVEDNEGPTLACPTTFSTSLDENGVAAIPEGAFSAIDNCGAVSVSLDATSATCDDIEGFSVTATVTDMSATGNPAVCSAFFIPIDDTDPTVTCANSTIEVNLNAQGVGIIDPDDAVATSDDNCEIAATTVLEDAPTCDDADLTVTYTLQVSDPSNNTE